MSATALRGGAGANFDRSRAWNSLTSVPDAVAIPVVQSSTAYSESDWSMAGNKRSHISAPPLLLQMYWSRS